MSEPAAVWTQAGQTFSTSLSAIRAAGGERKVTLPDSPLTIGDVQWEARSQRDGTIALVKVLPRVASRQLIIRPE